MKYYINSNKQPEYQGGNYEVHKETCPYYYNYKDNGNFIFLGNFNSSQEAIYYAKTKFPAYANKIDGCYHCCRENHYQ